MAASTKKPAQSSKKKALIDPIYQKYMRGVIRALGSTEFYAFFMDALSRANNEIQFSNRKMIKTVDVSWVDAIEDCVEAFQKIIASPRNVINEEELIVNVANAKKGGADTVRHLASHASLVEDFKPETGDVRPSKLMQKYREDSIGLFENRLVYTVLEESYQFVKIRHDALFSAMSDEFGAKLKVRSEMESASEAIHMDMFLHIKDIDTALETDAKNREIFERISRLHRLLGVFMNSPFANQLAKLPRVRGAITKTNVLKKNPYYRSIMLLGEFLRSYDDVGYSIKVVEQNPVVTEAFTQGIYHSILFDYLILKGYLEDEKDRQVPVPAQKKGRVLKPKFIKEIIEELTEDYDLPDVEIRKVLIEELTKEQLMHEEAEERRRLVEEQARRKKEEAERIRQEKAAEKERIRKEKEAEKERLRQEKEAEEARLRQERMERELEDRRRSKIIRKELAHFQAMLPKQMEARQKAEEKGLVGKESFEDAARLLEEAEQRKLEAKEREKKRAQEAKERQERAKALAKEKAEREEAERKAAELRAKQAEEERKRREEEERQAELRRVQEEKEERERREQDVKDTAAVRPYADQITIFLAALPNRLELREEEISRARQEREAWEQARRDRMAARAAASVK